MDIIENRDPLYSTGDVAIYQGIIIDEKTNTPISGALVTFESNNTYDRFNVFVSETETRALAQAFKSDYATIKIVNDGSKVAAKIIDNTRKAFITPYFDFNTDTNSINYFGELVQDYQSFLARLIAKEWVKKIGYEDEFDDIWIIELDKEFQNSTNKKITTQTLLTNKNGEWSVKFPLNSINTDATTITFGYISKPGEIITDFYELKTIHNPVKTNVKEITEDKPKTNSISLNPIPIDKYKPYTKQMLEEQTGFVLVRERNLKSYSPGVLYYKKQFVCFTNEDPDRTYPQFFGGKTQKKVQDYTCIPANRPSWKNNKPYTFTLSPGTGNSSLKQACTPIRGLNKEPANWSTSTTHNAMGALSTPGTGPGRNVYAQEFGSSFSWTGVRVHYGNDPNPWSSACVNVGHVRVDDQGRLGYYTSAPTLQNGKWVGANVKTKDIQIIARPFMEWLNTYARDNEITTMYIINDEAQDGVGFYDLPPTVSKEYTYDIPRVSLVEYKPIDLPIRPIIIEKNNEIIIRELNHLKLDPQEVLINHINSYKQDIIDSLIPALSKLLQPFNLNPTDVIKVINNQLNVDDLKSRLPKSSSSLNICPSQSQISDLISKRNALTRQINIIFKTIRTLSTSAAILSTLIQAVETGVKLTLLNPYPVPASVSDFIIKSQDNIKKYSTTVSGATLVLASFGVTLGIVLSVLKILDASLLSCSKDNDIPFEKINDELNNSINISTGVNNNTIIREQDKTYKGFTLEIKFTQPATSYPRRYAQALNKQKIPVLKTEPSFTSDPQLLLSELKFIIDSNPNLTAE